MGGGKKDLFIISYYRGPAYGSLDPSKATLFELIPQNDGYSMLKSQEGSCLSHYKTDYLFPWGGGYAQTFTDCKPNNDNLWKNAHGQVYNKDGRSLWWNGDKCIKFFIISKIINFF